MAKEAISIVLDAAPSKMRDLYAMNAFGWLAVDVDRGPEGRAVAQITIVRHEIQIVIDVDMGYMLGATENLGIGVGVITSLQGTQLSQNVALEGKLGVAVTGMYTGLPVLLRGRLYAAAVVEGEGGNVAAAAQGGSVNVYFHVADEILEGDIGPFATAGYEVDRTNVETTIFRLNVALGFSFL